ncbi:MAG: DUF2007 domain-containing protein [Bacillota bacterium]
MTIAKYSNAGEAHITRGLLESEGIEAYVFDELSAAYTPLAVGGVRLVVRQSDLERAVKILEVEEKKQEGSNKKAGHQSVDQ